MPPPFSPPSGPAWAGVAQRRLPQRLFQEHPAKSKFLAVVEVRNIAGVTRVLEKGDIVERQKREKSMMPDGQLNALTPEDLVAILAYLESTKGK